MSFGFKVRFLSFEIFHIADSRNRVRHFDDRGDATHGGRARGVPERFFVQSAAIARVHMRINEAGKNLLAARIQRLLRFA